MSDTALPVVYFDPMIAEMYRDLTNGRCVVVGPDDDALATAQAAVVGVNRRWNAALISLGPELKVISRTGIGYDNVDVAAAAAAGVAVCNAPEAPSASTAEHTLALMLSLTKHIEPALQRARDGLTGSASAMSLELDGRTLGLVGLGRIARRVAVAGVAMGMDVIAHDPFLTESPIDGVKLAGLNEVIANSDVLCLHAPGGVETRHMINAESLGRMKAGSYLINCARGSLVDQDALLDALDSGRLAGAALDVTEPEPLPVDHRLLHHPRAMITPHIASSTAAGRRRLYEHAIDNALNVLTGRPATIVAGSIVP
jgi:D-3-phosphoglycerate dehydrogenase / 2-oxoglutarate reductase